MRTIIAALALLSFPTGPVFAQDYVPPQGGYDLLTPDDPAFIEERSIGNVWGHWMTRPGP
jgi:hypothetical protein